MANDKVRHDLLVLAKSHDVCCHVGQAASMFCAKPCESMSGKVNGDDIASQAQPLKQPIPTVGGSTRSMQQQHSCTAALFLNVPAVFS